MKPKAGDRVSKVIRIEWSEADPVDVDGDVVFYELQLSRNANDSEPIWEPFGTFSEGESGAFFDVSEFEDDTDYQLRIRATDAVGDSSDFNMSVIF